MSDRDDYFARVVPLLGQGLSEAVVSIEQVPLVARVVELLASCMLRKVVVHDPGAATEWPVPELFGLAASGSAPESALSALKRHLAWKNGFAAMEWLREGRGQIHLRGRSIDPGRSPHVQWDESQRTVTLNLVRGDRWSHQNVTCAVARQVRDILLGRCPWPRGTVHHGSRFWPFSESAAPAAPPEQRVIALTGAHVMVVGVGSVGSEVVRLLDGQVGRWTLVDGATVTVFNPYRQWFGTDEIGRRKVEALASRLGASRVRAVPDRVVGASIRLLEELIDASRPHAVLLATGTSDDARIARILRRRRIPHVAAYAYPQARFFEITVVDEGTPCLHCYRGNLFRGLESVTPIPDETASFLYRQPHEGQREELYRNLVAEPATAIDTGRIADVAAMCVGELLAPPADRSGWFRRMLESGTTCLLGGNVVEDRGEGETAYGLTYPGQVVRLGVGDIAGTEDRQVCSACGLSLEVSHRYELPGTDDAAVDAALLE
ncbi:MAG: ThiF family adenylyltransferase [Candidatus Riflebacteria bacterium]|nr:ThiF family adenylyltransferase [Candidatus Riflebacteria bacterium]